MTLGELRERLYDPAFDISPGGWRVIDDVSRIYRARPDADLVREIVQQLLLRLIVEEPHVFAITVGQFPGFEGIEAFWEKSRYRDGRGFLWFPAEPFGSLR